MEGDIDSKDESFFFLIYSTTLDTIETRTLPLVAERSEEGWRRASQVQSPGSKDEREREWVKLGEGVSVVSLKIHA